MDLNKHVEALMDSGLWGDLLGAHLSDNYLCPTSKRRYGFYPWERPMNPPCINQTVKAQFERRYALWLVAETAWYQLVDSPGDQKIQKAFVKARDAYHAVQDEIGDFFDAQKRDREQGISAEIREAIQECV